MIAPLVRSAMENALARTSPERLDLSLLADLPVRAGGRDTDDHEDDDTDDDDADDDDE